MSEHDLVPDDNEDGLLAHPGDDDLAPPPTDPDVPDSEADDAGDEVQGSVDTPDGVEGAVVSVPVGGDGPPIDVPKAAYDDPGPAPITPASSQEQYDARVKFEDQLNGQLAAWWDANRAEVLAALAAGETPTVNRASADLVTDDEDYAPKS